MVRKLIKRIFKKAGYILIKEKNLSNRVCNILFEKYGLLKSIHSGQCIDNDGNPIPWFTYPAIDYLKQLNLADKTLLEWGSGNSTIFFASRVKEALSIEHSESWYNKLVQIARPNQHLVLANETNYISKVLEINKKFDIIIIDGINREKCIEIAPIILNNGGLIIFDNSDRHPDLCKIMREKSLLQVDMHGFGPINEYTWTTSFFFHRDFNFEPLKDQPQIPIGGGY